jgi:hypothetical protein
MTFAIGLSGAGLGSFPFKGKVGMGMGFGRLTATLLSEQKPIPTLALPLKGRGRDRRCASKSRRAGATRAAQLFQFAVSALKPSRAGFTRSTKSTSVL